MHVLKTVTLFVFIIVRDEWHLWPFIWKKRVVMCITIPSGKTWLAIAWTEIQHTCILFIFITFVFFSRRFTFCKQIVISAHSSLHYNYCFTYDNCYCKKFTVNLGGGQFYEFWFHTRIGTLDIFYISILKIHFTHLQGCNRQLACSFFIS